MQSVDLENVKNKIISQLESFNKDSLVFMNFVILAHKQEKVKKMNFGQLDKYIETVETKLIPLKKNLNFMQLKSLIHSDIDKNIILLESYDEKSLAFLMNQQLNNLNDIHFMQLMLEKLKKINGDGNEKNRN